MQTKQGQEKQDAKMRQASQMYEQHFLREMVKAMRKTVEPSDLTKPTMAENIYRDNLDQQYVDGWAKKGGIGLGDMIYEQLKHRLDTQNGKGFNKPQGAMPVAQKKYLQIKDSKE